LFWKSSQNVTLTQPIFCNIFETIGQRPALAVIVHYARLWIHVWVAANDSRQELHWQKAGGDR
jgi:hypothetical protein